MVLGLGPRDLWTLTPRELAAAGRMLAGGRPDAPGRGELQRLMAMFPDMEPSDGPR